ncbi:MAG: NfeD-like family protein 1 [Bordetella sp. SCN 67-23]|nr:NfeD family protein [Burkholderiales bacterium]ODS73649.1 MAG: NfeD-like family protein 1 [Bordetella sp. SCN 67-23]OJW93421.1 MAG: NfeD-like family protein 1 [Burkholderiales bacterium 67-32]
MNPAWVWFGLMALALIGEVMTGTFYLLMVAVGFAVAGIAAWLGVDIAWQLVLCAAAVVLCTLLLKRLNVLKKRGSPPSSNANVNMDIGQTVKVEAWNEDRTARVWYRGAHWQAELAPGAEPVAGQFVITEMRGNSLVLSPSR